MSSTNRRPACTMRTAPSRAPCRPLRPTVLPLKPPPPSRTARYAGVVLIWLGTCVMLLVMHSMVYMANDVARLEAEVAALAAKIP